VRGRVWARCATCKKATYICAKQGCKPNEKASTRTLHPEVAAFGPLLNEVVANIAEATSDAFSADAYRSWPACVKVCLERGYSLWETEDILRSKITRWARDAYDGPDNGRVPAKALAAWLDKRGRENVAAMLEWTERRGE
jgi:hypothetical protein